MPEVICILDFDDVFETSTDAVSQLLSRGKIEELVISFLEDVAKASDIVDDRRGRPRHPRDRRSPGRRRSEARELRSVLFNAHAG